MIPQGVEIRPELQVRNDVVAFGFSGERIADPSAVSLLEGSLLDYILTTAELTRAGLVVVDVRNIDFLSTTGLQPLLTLRQKLRQLGRQLLLLISDPISRAVLSATRLDNQFLVAASETELHELVGRCPPIPARSSSQAPPAFSETELTQMEAAGLTLDDAIRAIEGLRR